MEDPLAHCALILQPDFMGIFQRISTQTRTGTTPRAWAAASDQWSLATIGRLCWLRASGPPTPERVAKPTCRRLAPEARGAGWLPILGARLRTGCTVVPAADLKPLRVAWCRGTEPHRGGADFTSPRRGG